MMPLVIEYSTEYYNVNILVNNLPMFSPVRLESPLKTYAHKMLNTIIYLTIGYVQHPSHHARAYIHFVHQGYLSRVR